MKKASIALLFIGLLFIIILGLQLWILVRLEHIEHDIDFIERTIRGKNKL